MGPVSQYVAQLVRRKLDQHLVLVWYDPTRVFAELVDHLDLPPGTRLARFAGSYFELRAEAEEYFARMTRTAGRPAAPLLVYVPAAPLPRQIDPLLGLAAAGGVLKETIVTLAREALRGRYSESDLDDLLSNPNLSLAELDRLAAQGPSDGTMGVISLVFGPVATHEVFARYLTEADLEAAVAEKGALPALAALAERSLGLPREPVVDQVQFKRRLARHLLLTDLRAGLPEGVSIPSAAGMPVPDVDQTQTCRMTVDLMRQRLDMQSTYKELAMQVEREFNLRQISLPAAAVAASETFPFSDDLCLAAVEDLLEQGDVEGARDLAARRLQTFWAQTDERRKVQWKTAQIALDLFAEARRVLEEVKGRRLTPETMVERHAALDGGWYRMDGLHRALESMLADVEEQLQFERLLRRAREAYREALEVLADRLLSALEEHGFQFYSILHQTDIFHRFVEPHLNGSPVAYFLVDALRYEMGVDLLRLLDRAQEAEVRPAIAAVPTITVVGMAALMPGAEKGMALATTPSGKLAAQVGEALLAGAADRLKLLESVTGGALLDITLDELLTSPKYARPTQLKERLAGKRLVVIRAVEIDSEGESDLILPARRGMSRVLADLKRAVHRLAAAGVERFVITADHGYLFVDHLNEAMKIDPPAGGEEVCRHRRCWVGRGGDRRPAFVRFRAAELGMGGDLEFAFPRGLGAFKVPGAASSYYHGGLTLQELVVPMLTFRMPAPEQAAAGDVFKIRLDPPRVTNRFFMVTVLYVRSLLSPPTRRVRLELMANGQLVGHAKASQYGYDPSSEEITLESGKDNTVTLFFKADQANGDLVIQMKDAESGVVLAEEGPIPFEFTS
ncbi:PglZ domain-containing protein [Symbiobacterium terraclitae]|uniref:PglZ domain-containing protein n=1 Tax=Symbiobacterium terraclitae TaxID=557451 RepID=UPI0035B50EBE